MGDQPGDREESRMTCKSYDIPGAADADFMELDGAIRSGQFHDDPPLHPALLVPRDQANP
jgi:hypothetical protein